MTIAVAAGFLARAVAVKWTQAADASSASKQDRATLHADARTPEPVKLPRPQAAVTVADDSGTDTPITLRLAQDLPAGNLLIRRAAVGDGRLYLGIRADGAQPLSGSAEVGRGEGKSVRGDIVDGELWLSLMPRFGEARIRVTSPTASPVGLLTPTTLVEIRGRQIYVNGEPFLIKGAMSRNLTARDAGYVRSLGINTLRGQDALGDCERFGFMCIASLGFGNTATKESMHQSDAEFDATLDKAMDWLRDNCKAPVASPNTLIVQLGNEKTPGSAMPPDRPVPEPAARARRHASQLLVRSYNVIKPLAPGLPVGYANQDLGFLAPDCMDVYMHNSFSTRIDIATGGTTSCVGRDAWCRTDRAARAGRSSIPSSARIATSHRRITAGRTSLCSRSCTRGTFPTAGPSSWSTARPAGRSTACTTSKSRSTRAARVLASSPSTASRSWRAGRSDGCGAISISSAARTAN